MPGLRQIMHTVSVRIYAPLSQGLGIAQGWGRPILEQAIEPGESVRDVFSRLAEQSSFWEA